MKPCISLVFTLYVLQQGYYYHHHHHHHHHPLWGPSSTTSDSSFDFDCVASFAVFATPADMAPVFLLQGFAGRDTPRTRTSEAFKIGPETRPWIDWGLHNSMMPHALISHFNQNPGSLHTRFKFIDIFRHWKVLIGVSFKSCQDTLELMRSSISFRTFVILAYKGGRPVMSCNIEVCIIIFWASFKWHFTTDLSSMLFSEMMGLIGIILLVSRTSLPWPGCFTKFMHSAPQFHTQQNRKQLGETVLMEAMLNCYEEDGRQQGGLQGMMMMMMMMMMRISLLQHVNVRSENKRNLWFHKVCALLI